MEAGKADVMISAGGKREAGGGGPVPLQPTQQVASTGQPCPQIHPHWSPGHPSPPHTRVASDPCACLSPACLLVRFQLTPISDPAAQCRAVPIRRRPACSSSGSSCSLRPCCCMQKVTVPAAISAADFAELQPQPIQQRWVKKKKKPHSRQRQAASIGT